MLPERLQLFALDCTEGVSLDIVGELVWDAIQERATRVDIPQHHCRVTRFFVDMRNNTYYAILLR